MTDYAALINWGDGTSSSGTVTPGSGGFVVTGTHTYSTSGTFTVTVAISDAGGATATATSTATVAPSVAGLSPSSGQAGGGTPVTITGAGLTGATAVKFGSAAATFTVVNSTTIITTSPSGSGTVDVIVTTPGGTSATGAADRFGYTTTPALVTTGAPSVISSTSAAFTATVDPNGLGTTVQFQYGPALPAADTGQARGGTSPPFTYSSTTAPQSLPGDFSDHVVTTTVADLLPNTVYHVRTVATNGAGTSTGPDQTFTTPTDPPPPPPVLGKSFDVSVVSGLVLVKLPHGAPLYAADLAPRATSSSGLPGGPGFIPLTEARNLPSGTEVDARLGKIKLVSATGKRRKTQTGTFNGSLFKITQQRSGANKGMTNLSLLEGLFPGAPTYASCKKGKAADTDGVGAHEARLSSRVLQTLRASGHGKFRTSGRFGAATVLGTVWGVRDRCDGTLITVFTDTVLVTDFVRHKTLIVHAGHTYLARAPATKHK